MSNFNLNTTFGIGDEIKLIFDLSNNGSGSPTVDLDITIGANNQNIYSSNGLSPQNNITVTHTITSANQSEPVIKFVFTNSNAGDYTWGTNLEIFKKIEEVFTQVQSDAKQTLAWSDSLKRWVSRYSYLPEYYSTFKTGIVSFLNGDLYIHDDSTNKNYFYGSGNPTFVSYIENEMTSQPKVFLTHSIEGDNKPDFTTFETVENHTMQSDLLSSDYNRKEGTYYSELFGDTNDPNIEGSFGDKLLKGTKLRGQYIKVGVTFRDNNLKVKHSNIGYITSKGHNTGRNVQQ
jgi:hypothetical protein|tara:strand:+ start:2986 stop:3852 length:867 start_codon:yes stop_codon:yes gene_type:complete